MSLPGFTAPASVLPFDPELIQTRDERLASVKAALIKLAHDFNNQLVPIQGYATLIREEQASDSSTFRYATSLETAVSKTGGFLEGILNSIRPERHFEEELFNFGALLQQRVADLRQQTKWGNVQWNVSLEPLPLRGDPAWWKETVDHLLTNALAALPEASGELTIYLKRLEINHPPAPAHPNFPPMVRDWLHLSVQDSGAGIPNELLEKIFDPFYTTRARQKARGLGLTMVHSVVRLHGGYIQVISPPGEGTKVDIVLPLTALRQKENPPLSEDQLPVRHARKLGELHPAVESYLSEQGTNLLFGKVQSNAPVQSNEQTPRAADLVVVGNNFEIAELRAVLEAIQRHSPKTVMLVENYSNRLSSGEKVPESCSSKVVLIPTPQLMLEALKFLLPPQACPG